MPRQSRERLFSDPCNPFIFLDLTPARRLGSVEEACASHGLTHLIGIDEAGRGPLAGPVLAGAALISLDSATLGRTPSGLDDSKRLSTSQREALYPAIGAWCAAWAVCGATVEEIDRLNIRAATILAMQRAVATLALLRPDDAMAPLLIDGDLALSLPDPSRPQTALVGGDGRSVAIAAASVLAKVERDRLMIEADRVFPGYGFARHKGYGVMAHIQALREQGPCPIHRKSFVLHATD